jgi:hypothetical protein
MLSQKPNNAVATGALLLGSLLTGCSLPEREFAADTQSPAKTPVSTDEPKNTYSISFSTEDVKSFAGKATDTVTSYGKDGIEYAKGLGRQAWVSTDSFIHSPTFAGTINSAVQSFGEQLKKLESDPVKEISTQEKLQRLGIRQIPVLGSLDRYADARACYNKAQTTLEDLNADSATREQACKLQQQAKRECLLACVQAGINLSIVGLPDHLDLPFEYADQAVDLLKVGKVSAEATNLLKQQEWITVSWGDIDLSRLDVLTPLMDKALENESVEETMIFLLTLNFNDPALEVR